jgi:cysteinyl-tRNA synthetase
MVIKIYHTQTRQKEDFQPLEAGKVKMYCCGVTVYDYCHLGHARSYIAWDIVRRYLEYSGYTVNYIQNFTDIDDKILNRAKLENTTMDVVSEKYIQAYFEDIRRLNIKDANAYPRVTEHLPQIIQLIQELADQGIAYAVDGDVYYSVKDFADYGKLSGRQQEQLQAGASGRISSSDTDIIKKKDPSDFALWKAAKIGEPAWDSPWGKGRPGWHIECSAMVRSLLGNTIDIHGGGGDLVFPHHENEIAQSEAATHQPLANYWMHNGMVRVSGEKMSKSLGNFTTIRGLLDSPLDAMVIRLFILQAHYRKPLDFTDEAIASAENGWNTLKEGLLFGSEYGDKLGFKPNEKALIDPDAIARFKEAMDDDFNTPEGLVILFELAKELRRDRNILIHGGDINTPTEHLQKTWQTLMELATVFGLEAQPEESQELGLSDSETEILVQQRLEAKKAKNYAESDRIRDQLKELGITLIDQPGNQTIWHR